MRALGYEINFSPFAVSEGTKVQRESMSVHIAWRTWADVAADDKKRDRRNVERRKIIKKQTTGKNDSFANSIKIAKVIIDAHAKNKKKEKKASQKRRIIKHCTSEVDNRRRMSLTQQLETARSIIVPDKSQQESLERSKNKSRLIKDQLAGKRRPSFSEEIEVGKKVIVDSEKRFRVPPAVAQEVSCFHFIHISLIV